MYQLMRLLARVMLTLFFRRLEVAGRSQVPLSGPVLFVPNHANALVDPVILVVTLRRRLTLTAKHVLAGNPLLGWLMARLGIITFHRKEDVGQGADRKENAHSLDRCREVLAAGGAVCIFPEGVSHSDPSLRPFRAGAARLAIDYVRTHGNPGGLRIVPVGLLYTEKDQFRSSVWLRYGMPMDVAEWLAGHPDADVGTLTEELRRRVESLTVQYATRRESAILNWAAEIVVTGGSDPAPLGWSERPLAEWFSLVTRLQSGYRALKETQAEEIETLTKRVRRYRAELKRAGIAPGEVYLPLHGGKALFFALRELELLVIGLPFALFGALNHALPYFLVKWIARKWSKDKDHWATNVVYPSFLIFPLCYALQLTAAWLGLPAFWAALYTIALPYTGYVALFYGDRLSETWRRLRTFCYFLGHRAQQEELAGEGRAIIAAIRALDPAPGSS